MSDTGKHLTVRCSRCGWEGGSQHCTGVDGGVVCPGCAALPSKVRLAAVVEALIDSVELGDPGVYADQIADVRSALAADETHSEIVKPCPFCGSVPRVWDAGFPAIRATGCSGCSIPGMSLESWNTRY